MRERERERERERWKARRVNPTLRVMLSPNYGKRACKKRRGTRTVHSLRGKSSGIISGNYPWIIVWELSVGIIVWELSCENYELLVYHHAEKLRFIGILAYPKILDLWSYITLQLIGSISNFSKLIKENRFPFGTIYFMKHILILV